MIDESQKYPDNKDKYDRGYMRIFGVKCPTCKGSGQVNLEDDYMSTCNQCKGIGYVMKTI